MDRDDIIRRIKRQRREIEQYFTDVASWNENARKPDEEPIDPDPTGSMRRLAVALDEAIAMDEAKGGVGSIDAPSLSIIFHKAAKSIN